MVKRMSAAGDVSDAAIKRETTTPHAATENLADLVHEAEALDATPSPANAQAQAQQEQEQAERSQQAVQMILAGLQLARRLAKPNFEWWLEFGDVWSDDTLTAQAQALDDFGTAMGWDAGELLDRFGPYIKLAFAFGLPVFVTWQAIQLRREQIEAHRRQQQQQARAEGGDDGGQQ